MVNKCLRLHFLNINNDILIKLIKVSCASLNSIKIYTVPFCARNFNDRETVNPCCIKESRRNDGKIVFDGRSSTL